MKVSLDLHDFSVVNNRMLWLLKLKERFPGFKVSLFTVAVDETRDWGPYLIRGEFLDVIKKNLDWIQLIPHGLTHNGSEVKNMTYDGFMEKIGLIEGAFKKDGLPYEKGFGAPHWRWNEEVVRALNDMGWWGAVDPRQPNMPTPNRFYRYSQPIDNFDLEGTLKLHGHIYGTRNDLGLCFEKLMDIPEDAEWHFVTDFLEEK